MDNNYFFAGELVKIEVKGKSDLSYLSRFYDIDTFLLAKRNDAFEYPIFGYGKDFDGQTLQEYLQENGLLQSTIDTFH